MHLHIFMAKNKLRDRDVALAIGRSRVTINRIRRGIQRPDWEAIAALREFSKGKVTANDFIDLPEVEGAE